MAELSCNNYRQELPKAINEKLGPVEREMLDTFRSVLKNNSAAWLVDPENPKRSIGLVSNGTEFSVVKSLEERGSQIVTTTGIMGSSSNYLTWDFNAKNGEFIRFSTSGSMILKPINTGRTEAEIKEFDKKVGLVTYEEFKSWLSKLPDGKRSCPETTRK